MTTAIAPLRVAFKQCCPQCGETSLFVGLLKVKERCENCGLPTGKHDVGDGPVYCAMTLLCFFVTIIASYIEIAYTPPMWLHAIVALTLTLSLTPLSLRFFTAYIVATQHRDGELRDGPDED